MLSKTRTLPVLLAMTPCVAASGQDVIYSCDFDQPTYAIGSIDGQNGWVTFQAAGTAPGLTAMAISATAGALAPQAGNGCLFSENGPDASTSGRFAIQSGVGKPIIDAIAAACAANATSIEFSCYMLPPTPQANGTTLVGARHGMVLYVSTDATSQLKAAVGFQCRAFDGMCYVMQWLDVGQLGVGTAGNYLISFSTPLTLTQGTWNRVGCKWDRATGTPYIKINAGEWTASVTTSVVNNIPREFDIVNTRGSTSGGASNTEVSTAYFDSLEIVANGSPTRVTDCD